MKYKFELEINAPYDLVMELRDDPRYLVQWQPELKECTRLSGEAGAVGSQTRLTYQLNGRPVEITETVTVRNPPHEFAADYATTGVVNHVTNRYAETGPDSTYWQYDSEVEFTNFLMRLVGMFMGNAFRDQSWRYMNLFKQFAEQEYTRRQ